MDRASWEYRESVKKEAVRRFLLRYQDVVKAMVNKDGLMAGDVKLNPLETISYVTDNVTAGVHDVKESIAPKMASKDLTAFRQAVRSRH